MSASLLGGCSDNIYPLWPRRKAEPPLRGSGEPGHQGDDGVQRRVHCAASFERGNREIEVRRGAGGGGRVRSPAVPIVADYAGVLLQYRGATLEDVHTARMMVETPAARLLAERSPKDKKVIVSRLRTALGDEAAVMDDPAALTRAEGRFHQLIVELTGNDTLPMLSAVANRIIAEQVKKSMKGGNGNATRRYKEAHRAHERLVELIEAGKADEAQALWRKHLEGGFAHLSGGGTKSERVLDLMS